MAHSRLGFGPGLAGRAVAFAQAQAALVVVVVVCALFRSFGLFADVPPFR